MITERDGREVFRDSEAYSSRHGVGITWCAGTDELWVLSSDVGTSSVRRGADGNWSKEYPRPGYYEQDMPAKIREFAGGEVHWKPMDNCGMAGPSRRASGSAVVT